MHRRGNIKLIPQGLMQQILLEREFQGDGAAADFITATAIGIGYATLAHIYDSKDCSTVLHNFMLLSR